MVTTQVTTGSANYSNYTHGLQHIEMFDEVPPPWCYRMFRIFGWKHCALWYLNSPQMHHPTHSHESHSGRCASSVPLKPPLLLPSPLKRSHPHLHNKWRHIAGGRDQWMDSRVLVPTHRLAGEGKQLRHPAVGAPSSFPGVGEDGAHELPNCTTWKWSVANQEPTTFYL